MHGYDMIGLRQFCPQIFVLFMATRYFHLFCKKRHKMLAGLMAREVYANVNTGISIVECLREFAYRSRTWD